MIDETLHLLTDGAHWVFEAITDLVFGVLGGAVLWPRIKAHFHRDIRHAENHAWQDAITGSVHERDFEDEVHA